MKKLSQRGLDKNTVFAIVADHGENLISHPQEFFNHGHTVYDTTVHVPLIFYAPALWSGERVVTQVVSTVDLTPTLCDVAGLPLLEAYEGRSVTPLLYDEGADWHPRPVFSEATKPWDSAVESDPRWRNQLKSKCIRTEEWKLVLNPMGPPKWQLFFLKEDPGGQNDLYEIESQKNPEMITGLEQRLREWMNDLPDQIETNMPVLHPEVLQRLRSLGYTR